jgi:hypothetical protein
MTVAAAYQSNVPPACAVPSVVGDVVHNSAMARKRRRLKLKSQRAAASDVPGIRDFSVSQLPIATQPDMVGSGPQLPVVTSNRALPSSKRKVSDASVTPAVPTPTLSKTGKKPQMRYDPAVPMSKEETAAWRREQRRKRNRESAAASRQRQRDRIEELEEEVEEWKDKFNDAMSRLQHLEQLLLRPPLLAPVSCATVPANVPMTLPSMPSRNPLTVSPSSSPPHSPVQSSLSSRTIPGPFLLALPTVDGQTQDETSKTHLNETISRPA